MIELLEPYKPQMPIEQLVVEVNKLYHAFEAKDYDNRHPEVCKQLPALWGEMVYSALALKQQPNWRILDFGCGTGFASAQLIQHLVPDSITHLTCYDSSPEMLEQCAIKIRPLFPQAVFCSDIQSLLASERQYNLLATNSVLHHLPDPAATLTDLLPILSANAIWLAGHEPSSRFYKNSVCQREYTRFLKQPRWRRFSSPKLYLYLLKQRLGLVSNPAMQTAKEAVRCGLFLRKPPTRLIGLLVDFHVAHSVKEAQAGRGFDFELLQDVLAPAWQLAWVKTYSFMGSYYEGYISRKWSSVSWELASLFPNDGANFCSVWQRA